MSSIEKNGKLIKDELVEQMNEGLGHLNKLLGRMFGTGVTGFILNPIARLLYKILLSEDIKHKTKNQIDIVLECANLYKSGLNGGSNGDINGDTNEKKDSNLDNIIDEYFEDYRENDQSFHHCRKKHKIYPEIEQRMKEVFKSRIEPANKLLYSDGNSYGELSRDAFKKEEAYANVDREFNSTAEMLELLKENVDVMDVPGFIRLRIIRIMIKAFNMTKKQIYDRLEAIYINNA